MDESGHDHKNMPFEVRGGVALHSGSIWNFTTDWQEAVMKSFGPHFYENGGEIKGSKLLDRKKVEWSNSLDLLSEKQRHKGVNRFLTQKRQKQSVSKRDFAAYGQACRMMARETFDLLLKHDAVLFASLIPRGTRKPHGFEFDHLLRKDHIFLQERFFYFLEYKQEQGLFVMDQTEKENDKGL